MIQVFGIIFILIYKILNILDGLQCIFFEVDMLTSTLFYTDSVSYDCFFQSIESIERLTAARDILSDLDLLQIYVRG